MAKFFISGHVVRPAKEEQSKDGKFYVITVAENVSKDVTVYLDVLTHSKEIAEHMYTGMAVAFSGNISTYKKEDKITRSSYWETDCNMLSGKDDKERLEKARAEREKLAKSEAPTREEKMRKIAEAKAKRERDARGGETEDERIDREFEEAMKELGE